MFGRRYSMPHFLPGKRNSFRLDKAMKIKLDENLGKTHVAILQESGYEAHRTYEEGLSGASDREVWEHVCAEGRFFITLDLDFSDVRKYPPGSHPGILLLRVDSRGLTSVSAALRRVIGEFR